jgi:hypothetical protein
MGYIMNKVQLEYLKKENWIINRKGKEFITYAGLLWLAHQDGLISVESVPVHEDYEKFFFCFRATVTGEKIINGSKVLCTFTDEGDASTKNVGKMITPHLRRMASTRAIVRALRLYTGCGITASEELGE